MQYKRDDYAEPQLLHNAFMEPSLKAAITSLNLPTQKARVLDVGCGPGGVFPYLHEAIGSTGEIIGVDNSEAHLARAKELVESLHLERGIKLVKLNFLETLPFPKDYFDVIWIADVLTEGIEEPLKLLERLTAILKPKGTIAIYYRNWLRMMLLPGYVRLEHLICTAKEAMYAEKRGWEGKKHPECALHWLLTIGLTNARVNALTVHYSNPLPRPVRDYLGNYALPKYSEAIEAYGDTVGMNQGDKILWERISAPHNPGYILDQPEYYCSAFALLTVGQKPS